MIIFIFINPLISSFFEEPRLILILNLLSILFPLRAFTQTFYAVLQREHDFKKIAKLDLISYIISHGLIGIVLAIFGFGVFALIFSIIAQALFLCISMYYLKPLKIKFELNKNDLYKLMKFGNYYTLAKLFNYAAIKLDYLIVSKYISIKELGFYSKSYGLMNIPNNVIGKVLDSVLFSSFSSIQENNYAIQQSFYRIF